MGKVEIKTLVQRKSGRVVVQGQIGLGISVGEDMVVQASENFFDVSDTHGSSGRGLKIIVSGKREID